MTLDNENIDQVGNFTYLGSIISEDVKSRIANAQGVFSQLKKSLKEQEAEKVILAWLVRE